MINAGVPVIPGSRKPVYDVKAGAESGRQKIGYPVIDQGGPWRRRKRHAYVAQTPEEFEHSFPDGPEGSPDGVRR